MLLSFQTTYEELKQRRSAKPYNCKKCFQTTYEELKLAYGVVVVIIFSLPDYLWGIETWKPTFILPPDNRFQTTYEELKRGIWQRFDENCPASRLPMRNWNCDRFYTATCSCVASRLPMRNWNFFIRVSSSIVLSSFQTTYEELKLVVTVSEDRTYHASRLPMRNWNLASEVFRWLSCLHRFQTTYEELKRFRFFHQGAFQYRLPDYLWGIETTQEILLSQWNLASRLPMRNWNLRHFQNYRLQVRPASRLPMRNWNQK